MSGIADKIAGRIASVVSAETDGADAGEAPSEEAAPVVEAGEQPIAPSGEPGVASTTIEELAAGGEGELAPPPDPEAEERKTRHALLREKLREQSERRRASQLEAQARQREREAQADREAARKERSKWEALKSGNFKAAVTELGLNPLDVFNEMQREAIEASTPEAQIKAMRADFERQMGEKLTPLQETIDRLLEERKELAAQAYANEMRRVFDAEVQDAEFTSLRVEYDDADLMGYVKHFDQHPKQFFEAARAFGVRLTDPAKGFTMREILSVLKAAQVAHETGKKQRGEKYAPPAPAAPSAPKTPTVNGTAEVRDAGTTIPSDLAGERAAPPRRLTRKERIEAEIKRARG